MREKQQRILFLCVQRSMRATLAASLLFARVRKPWDIWCTEATSSSLERDLARRVLDELGMVLLAAPQTIEPLVGLSWEIGVVLASGETSACPIVPGARRRCLWTVEALPPASVSPEEGLLGYRRIRDTLRSHIDEELLLPSLHRGIHPWE
jgi:hypothetical protein